MWQPEVVIPEQFFPTPRAPETPERRLMMAVLRDAVVTVLKHAHASSPPRRVLFEEAKAYIGGDDREWPFSFMNLCDTLGIEPSYVRRGLRSFYDNGRPVRASRAVSIVPVSTRRKQECEPESC